MGNYVRKATFTSEKHDSERVFTPVNRRAHIVARKLGRRTKITERELAASVGVGSYAFYSYNNSGELKRIRFAQPK